MPGDSARINGKKGGRPPGRLNNATISKEQAKDALRAVVLKHMDRMLRSQIAHAIGMGHLFTRDKAGKFTKVESQDQVEELLAKGTEGEDYWIFTKDPSVQAFTDLLNRALGKPAEEVELSTPADKQLVITVKKAW